MRSSGTARRAIVEPALLLWRCRSSCAAFAQAALLLGWSPSRAALRLAWLLGASDAARLLSRCSARRPRLLRRLLRDTARGARRRLPEPATLTATKRLRPRYAGRGPDRIVGLADICLLHETLTEIGAAQILRAHLHGAGQRRGGAGEHVRAHLKFRNRPADCRGDKARFGYRDLPQSRDRAARRFR